MDPVRGVVELPVGVAVALLQRVPRAHAQLNRNNVGLNVREVVGCTGEVRGIAVSGESVARDVVAAAYGLELGGIRLQDGAELGMAVGPWRVVDGSHGHVMDHPPLIPAALVVDDEQSVDVGEYVDER